MKKFGLKTLGTVALGALLVGCATTPTTTTDTTTEVKQEEVSGPAKDFDWNATVESVQLDRTYTEQNSGRSFTTRLSGIEKAQEELETKKNSISDEKMKAALKVVDAVFVNQQNFDDVVQAAGYKNQKELFENIWKQFMESLATDYGFTPNEKFTFQEETYNMNVYGPMAFKVNINAYAKAGAYNLNDYKVEGDTVYLSLETPTIDTYQYFVKASYHSNFQSFFEPLALYANTARQEQRIEDMFYATALYRLAAVDYKADGYVDLQGMDYYPISKNYVALKVDNNGKVTIDMENLQNLLHINSKESNEKNKVKFVAE